MRKSLALCGMVAVASATAAITHNIDSDRMSPKCEVHYPDANVEDEYCTAYWQGDDIIIGPLSDVDGRHIVGS